MLDDISSVKSWEKISQGMVKMYQAEVLGKLPIMQHMMFGSFFFFEKVGREGEQASVDTCEQGHFHAYKEFPTCCGIRVPSAIAATQAKEKSEMRKPIPFD